MLLPVSKFILDVPLNAPVFTVKLLLLNPKTEKDVAPEKVADEAAAAADAP